MNDLKKVFDRNQQKLDKGNRIVNEIMNMGECKVIRADAYELRQFFEVNHNPQKGETGKSELDRWLEMLKGLYIYFHYDVTQDQLIFTKKFPVIK